jgi:hypothetical protein
VLAIEPESSKGDVLRQLVRDDVGAEFVLVTSAYAAVVAINRQIPDLLLFSESISDRHRERVVDHLKSVSRNGTPSTLPIPALRNGDRAAFASQIGSSLARQSTWTAPPPATAQALPLIPPPPALAAAPPVDPEPASEHVAVPAEIDPIELELLSQLSALEAASLEENVDHLNASGAAGDGIAAPTDDGAALTATIDSMLDELTVDPMAIQISTWPGLADRSDEIDQIEQADESNEDDDGELDISIEDLARSRQAGDRNCEAPEGSVDFEVHAAEIALVRAQADAKMAAEIERVRAEAAGQRAADLARVEAAAAVQREAEVARVKTEADARLEVEVGRVRMEAEEARRLHEQSQRDTAAELKEVRAQMHRLRATSAEQARAAVEQAVASEVVRAEAIAQASSSQCAVRDWPSDSGVADPQDRCPDVHVRTPQRGRKTVMMAAAAVAAMSLAGLAFGVLTIGHRSAPAIAGMPPVADGVSAPGTGAVPASGLGPLGVETIKGGETSSHRVTLPEGSLPLATAAGAEIVVEADR